MTTERYRDAKKYVHLSGATTAITRSGEARLHAVSVNTSGSTNLTLYDGPTAAGGQVAVIDCTIPGTLSYSDLLLKTGLIAVLSGTADVTIVYE